MTKISTYTLDEKITALDKWIGSDVNTQNRTKNFTPKKLAEYFNEDQVINIGVPLQYKYYTLDPLEARPNGTLTFETEIGPTVNFSSVTSFILSKYTTKQNIVSDFLNFLDGSKVLLFKSSDINSFGFYRISDIAIYDENSNFFVVTVEYETGNGFMQEDEDYMISLVSLAGDFIPTKTSELINDGDDGVNPFISELDINREEWDAAYEGKINSAEVTGDTTKTLTLTKQDGSTIEASWTDKGLDLELTTDGTSGEATLVGSILNIPDYTIDTSEFVHILGDEFVYDVKKFFQTDAAVSQLRFDNSRAIGSQPSIYMANTEGSNSIFITNQGSGTGIGISNTDDGYGQVITNDSIGVGLLVNNNGSGTSGLGGGVKIIGSSYAPSLTISNSAQGDSIFINSIGTSAGTPINLQQDGVTNFQVNKLGDVTANKFIKTGGTSVQYLMADGTVSTGPVLTGYVPYTGATANVDLGEFGISAGYFQADLTPTGTLQVGRMQWNSVDGTMDLRLMGNNVTLQIGEENVTRVVNKTGVNLMEANYQVVRVRKVAEGGAQGQRLAIVLAQGNNENNSTEVLGLVTETILVNQEGFVTSFGEVKQINTTGSLQGETWVDGDILYVSPTIPGQLTNIRPIAPNHAVTVGYVTYAHPNNGKIYMAIDTGYELGELHNVYAPSPTSNQSIYWNNTNSRYELNTIGGILGYTPVNAATTLTINGTAYDLSANRSWSVGTVTSVAALTLGTGGTDLSSTVANSTTTPVITLNVPTASATNRGALSSADWTTFNNKQSAGDYITSLTGEATASGPGAAAVTLNNASVTGKLLTGVNITGGTVLSTDTMLTAFGKLQNQINSLIGGSIYQGVWNANTNTPTLTSSVGTDGYYYIVNVAGNTNLNGITDWKIGDWAIFHGGTWQKVDNTESVSSVNGQTGAVSLTTSDIPEGPTNFYYNDSRARAALSFTAGSGAYNSTTGVITIPTNTSQLTNGANYITLASLSGTAPIQYNNTTGAISITQAGAASNGYLSSTDWNTFNNKQVAGNYVTIDTAQTITASKTFTVSTVTDGILVNNSSGRGIRINNSTSSSLFGLIINNETASTATSFAVQKSGTTLFTINDAGEAAGIKFIKTGGTSAQYLMADGSVSTLSNPITGAGTTNYIPKFTGASSLGNSLIFDNGSSISIDSSSYDVLKLKSTGSLNTLDLWLTDNNTTAGQTRLRAASGAFSILTGGNERFYVNSSGNVGIGTTTFNFSASNRTSLAINNSVSSIIEWQAGSATYGYAIASSGSFDIGSATAIPLTFNTNATERMRITSGGNVGIGTTSPVQKLDVFGISRISKDVPALQLFNTTSGDNWATIQAEASVGTGGQLVIYTKRNGNTEVARVRVSEGGNTLFYPPNFLPVAISGIGAPYYGSNITLASDIGSTQGANRIFSRYDGTGRAGLVFETATNSQSYQSDPTNLTYTEYMRITGLGNVGIGTTSPGQKLDVNGDISSGGTGINGSLKLKRTSDGAVINEISYVSATDELRLNNGSGSGNITFLTTSTERMRITSGGNLLIGTTTDTGSKLYVSGNIGLNNGSFYKVGGANLVNNSQYIPKATTLGYFVDSLIYDNGTNVGIGTTSPISIGGFTTLALNGSTGGLFDLMSGGTTYGRLYSLTNNLIIEAVGSSNIQFAANGAERMRITSGGNVGIGTTSPSLKLVVDSGSGSYTTIWAKSSFSVSSKYYASLIAGYALAGNQSAQFGYVYDTATPTNSFAHITPWGSVEGSKFMVRADGNVGIGTTTPTRKLEISGGVAGGVLITSNAGSTTLPDNGISLTTGFNISYLSSRSTGVSGGIADLIYSAKEHIFDNGTIERLRITSAGNVGIGTTSPSFQLQLSNDSAAKPGSPLWTVSSDVRIKENIRPYTDGIEKLMQVNPVYYDYNGKAGFSITKDNVGIIAQEMQEVLPNTIKTFTAKLNEEDENETELLSFNANELIYVLINSVKELKAEIEILKNK